MKSSALSTFVLPLAVVPNIAALRSMPALCGSRAVLTFSMLCCIISSLEASRLSVCSPRNDKFFANIGTKKVEFEKCNWYQGKKRHRFLIMVKVCF